MHRTLWKLTVALTTLSLSVSVAGPPAPGSKKPGPAPFDRERTALVITDPQNDFLSEKGIAYKLFADNLKELGTIENIERLFRAAKKGGHAVFVSPHFYFPHDSAWKSPGALQGQLLSLGALRRAAPIDARTFDGSGADFLERYKPFIYDGKTVITSPHKVYGPESNDLLLQLRSQGVDTVVLGGLAANLCTDSHMRALAEGGFKVFVVKDAVAAPGPDAYKAALVNYGFVANGVLTTEEAVAALSH
jgi:biuret amidohydrolase